MDEHAILLPGRVVPAKFMGGMAQGIAEKLLESYSGLESYIVVKNMVAILDQAADLLTEKAVGQADGMREAEVLGAKVSHRRLPSKWEYDPSDPDMIALEEELARVKERLDAHKLFLQQAAKAGKQEVVDTSSGVVVGAPKEITRGYTVAVSFR